MNALTNRDMASLSQAMIKVWPSLARPYEGIDLQDPSELWMAIFDLLDRPSTVSAGAKCGGSILLIHHSNRGNFSRQSGFVAFQPHSNDGEKMNQFVFGQHNGAYQAKIDFGSRSPTAASRFLRELVKEDLQREIQLQSENPENEFAEEPGLFGGLEMTTSTYRTLQKQFGGRCLTRVVFVD